MDSITIVPVAGVSVLVADKRYGQSIGRKRLFVIDNAQTISAHNETVCRVFYGIRNCRKIAVHNDLRRAVLKLVLGIVLKADKLICKQRDTVMRTDNAIFC